MISEIDRKIHCHLHSAAKGTRPYDEQKKEETVSRSNANGATKTLQEADADEDAMDIFGASKGQNLYTVHLYQVRLGVLLWCEMMLCRHDLRENIMSISDGVWALSLSPCVGAILFTEEQLQELPRTCVLYGVLDSVACFMPCLVWKMTQKLAFFALEKW